MRYNDDMTTRRPQVTRTTEDGRRRRVHADGPSVGLDAEGYVVAEWPGTMPGLWRLTECCQATYKGLEDGVGCRACYALVEEGELPAEPVSRWVTT
jgi:hypothetical protein